MRFVYILRSLQRPGQRYIGITDDLKQRLRAHNAGESRHTAKFRPWKVEVFIAFADENKAIAFEKYLKTGAGWAFSLKRM